MVGGSKHSSHRKTIHDDGACQHYQAPRLPPLQPPTSPAPSPTSFSSLQPQCQPEHGYDAAEAAATTTSKFRTTRPSQGLAPRWSSKAVLCFRITMCHPGRFRIAGSGILCPSQGLRRPRVPLQKGPRKMRLQAPVHADIPYEPPKVCSSFDLSSGLQSSMYGKRASAVEGSGFRGSVLYRVSEGV